MNLFTPRSSQPQKEKIVFITIGNEAFIGPTDRRQLSDAYRICFSRTTCHLLVYGKIMVKPITLHDEH